MDENRYNELQRNKRSSLTGAGYMCALVVEDLEGGQETINFDLISSISVTSSSNLTENTMMNGDIIADHIYREPDEVTISGSYGLFGNRNIQFSGPRDKLGNIEEYFENIKNKGYKCSIITRSLLNNSSTRFKTRENMVLTSIEWTHHQTSIEFSLTFTEQKTASLQTQNIPYTEEDEDGPEITDGIATSFTEEVLDWEAIYTLIIMLLDEDNMMTDEFKGELKELSFSESGLIWGVAGGVLVIGGAIAAAAVSNVIVASIGTALGVAAASGPVGWLVAAAGAIVAGFVCIGIGIANAIEENKRKQELIAAQERRGHDQFQYFEGDDERNEEELEDFFNFVGGIADYIKTLDNYITVYKIPTDAQQEMTIYIDDNNYVFKFNKISDSEGYQLTLSTPSKVIKQSTCWNECKTDISKLTDNNYLYKTSNRYRIYLMYSNLDENGNPKLSGKNVLTNYFILVSTISFENFNDLLIELIQNGGTVPRDRIQEFSNME